MPTTVTLQNNFKSAIGYMILLFIALVIPHIVGLYRRSQEKKRQLMYQMRMNPPKVRPVPMIVKSQYLRQLALLNGRLRDGKVSSKQGFQELSQMIRRFAKDYAGIEVTNKTLEEISRMDYPQLTELVSEYYAPEFAPNYEGDLASSIAKTRRVIETWS